MIDIAIRPATGQDAAVIAEIHTSSWRDAYAHILAPEFLNGAIEADRLAVWSERLREPPAAQLISVACDPPGNVQGFVCSYYDVDADWGSLVDNLHIRPELRGRGIGERLLRDAARQLSASAAGPGLHLWVFEANAAALRFYQRLGGRVVGRDRSALPAAGGKTVLRVHWPTIAQVG
jgi:ribosomal protein S18 acetylase RimI-like enzyme